MKRFTETTIWEQAWFRRLSPALKCLWRFLCDRCDCAGVLDFDPELAAFLIGDSSITRESVRAFEHRVDFLPNGKLRIVTFLDFQYGTVDARCPAHKPIIRTIQQHGIDYPICNLPDRVSTTPPEREKEAGKQKEREQVKEAAGPTFPQTLAAALSEVGTACPVEYTTEIWHQLMGRNCTDGTGQPVTRFGNYVKSRWLKVKDGWKPPKQGSPPADTLTLTEPPKAAPKPQIKRHWKRIA